MHICIYSQNNYTTNISSSENTKILLSNPTFHELIASTIFTPDLLIKQDQNHMEKMADCREKGSH